METIIYVSLALMLVLGVMAVMLRSLTKSAIALAAASVALGVILYELGSTWGALFEVSVCSGLVTVILISAISLSNAEKAEVQEQFDDKKRMSALPVILIICGVAMIAIALYTGFSLPEPVEGSPLLATGVEESFKEILWNNRQADIWGQMIIIITGSVSVVVLFKERD